MKLTKLINFMVLSASIGMSGCTAWLWAGGNGGIVPGSGEIVTQTSSHTQTIAQDNVHAFGKSRERLVMMGEHYWYFLDEKSTTQMAPIVNAKLPKAFHILNRCTDCKDTFVLTLTDEKTFGTDFVLFYPPQRSQEENILRELGFKKEKQGYTAQFTVKGNIYKASDNLKQDYRFEKALPVRLQQYHAGKTEIDGELLLSKIALTPVTLLGDIIILPLSLFFMPFN